MTMSVWHYILFFVVIGAIIAGVVMHDRVRAIPAAARPPSLPVIDDSSQISAQSEHVAWARWKHWIVIGLAGAAAISLFLAFAQRFSATAPNERGDFVVINHLLGTGYFCRGYQCSSIEFR